MKLQTTVLTLGAMLVGLAYYVYSPYPADADQPWMQMKASLIMRSASDVCDLQAKLGWSSSIVCKRWLAEKFLQSDPNQPLGDNDLEVTEPLFGGVRVRLYIPKDSNPERRGFVYIHGGGWIFGNVNLYDNKIRQIARTMKEVVVSVDYRLAPEHPYPTPLQDCIDATKYFLENAGKYGVNPGRIGIGGDSAGGNLAMAVALKLAKEDTNLPPLRALGLVYPALQMVDFNLQSYQTYTKGPFILQKRAMVEAWLLYVFGNSNNLAEFVNNRHMSPTSRNKARRFVDTSLLEDGGVTVKSDENIDFNNTLAKEVEKVLSNQFISPLLSSDEDLRKLPKTLLFTCQYDPLRDEGIILAKRLQNLHFPVLHYHYPGIQHGFFSSRSALRKGEEAMIHFIDFLERNL